MTRKLVLLALVLSIAITLVTPVSTYAGGWEPVGGPIWEAGSTYSEGACTGSDPHWIDRPYGWMCPSSKGRILLKHCELNPYSWKWYIDVWISNAEIHENIYGYKWANRTTDWNTSFFDDYRAAAQRFCLGPHPEYW